MAYYGDKRPYTVGKYRGGIIIRKNGSILSVNDSPIYPYEGEEYIDGNLDVVTKIYYSDEYGTDRYTIYSSYSSAESRAKELNDEYEEYINELIAEENERQRIKQEKLKAHWEIVDRLREERKQKRKQFFQKIKKVVLLQKS